MALGNKLLYIPDSWVAENIRIRESFETVKNTLRDCGLGKVFLSEPSSLSMAVPQEDAASFQVKGAVLAEQGVAGYRLISKEAPVEGKKVRVNTFCYLADLKRGIPFAVIEERTQYITRTGVMTAVGLQLLLNPTSKKRLVVVGTGNIAFTATLSAFTSLLLQELVIVARRAVSGRAFVERIEPYIPKDVNVSLVYDLQEAVADAGMVVMATSADEPLLYPDWLPEGVTVCVVGGAQELAPDFVAHENKIIVDDFEWCKQAGSIGAWINKGFYNEREIENKIYGTIGEIAAGKGPGRESPTEKIILIMQGMASLDIAMGLMTYKKAKESSDPRLQRITLY